MNRISFSPFPSQPPWQVSPSESEVNFNWYFFQVFFFFKHVPFPNSGLSTDQKKQNHDLAGRQIC